MSDGEADERDHEIRPQVEDNGGRLQAPDRDQYSLVLDGMPMNTLAWASRTPSIRVGNLTVIQNLAHAAPT